LNINIFPLITPYIALKHVAVLKKKRKKKKKKGRNASVPDRSLNIFYPNEISFIKIPIPILRHVWLNNNTNWKKV
jgi:hypothetical protein